MQHILLLLRSETCSFCILELIIDVSICAHVRGTTDIMMGQLGEATATGTRREAVWSGWSGVFWLERAEHHMLTGFCLSPAHPYGYTLQSSSNPALGPGFGCSAGMGLNRCDGGTLSPMWAQVAGPQQQKTRRGSQPQTALTVGGTVSWGVRDGQVCFCGGLYLFKKTPT